MSSVAQSCAIRESCYSTNVVPPAARIGFWNDISSQLFGSLRIDSRGHAPFHGEIVRLPLRDCELISVKSAPVTLTRRPGPCERDRMGDVLALELICSGHGHSRLAGQEMAIGPGDFRLMQSSSTATYSFDEPVHVIVLLLQATRLAHRMRQLRPYLNQRIRSDSGGPAILATFFRSTWHHMLEGFRPEWSVPLSETVWNLFDLAFPDAGIDLQSPSRRQERRRAAQRLVEIQLGNPDFGVHAIAEALHVSERYVQSLFSDLSTTPSKYLLGRRLEVAAERLRREPHARVGEVALSVGFNDLAYFSRAFRGKFGMPARTFRAQLV